MDVTTTLQGVVFNEMKGVYSSPESRMYRAAQQATFPDNTYAVDSGGDPTAIPDLTFEQFTGFHDAFYHPANSKIFFYGDDDPAVRLELLDSYLSDFTKPAEPARRVDTQPKKSSPWKVQESFPASEGSGHMVMVNWLLNEEPFADDDELAIGVLDHLLMGSRTSILYKVRRIHTVTYRHIPLHVVALHQGSLRTVAPCYARSRTWLLHQAMSLRESVYIPLHTATHRYMTLHTVTYRSRR